MRRSGLSALVLLLVLLLVPAIAGCAATPDDETAPRPTVTTTVTAAARPRPVAIPPLADPPPLTATASAQGARLRVGGRSADLSPMPVDAFALTRGGVFVLSTGRLWQTNLRVVRDTGVDGVASLAVSPDGRYLGLVAGSAGGAPGVVLVYDTTSGRAVVAGATGAAPAPVGFLPDGRFVTRTAAGYRAYPLDGGRAVSLPGGAAAAAQPGRVQLPRG